jgi:hypothetical protein
MTRSGGRLIAALQRRLRGPYRSLGALDARLHDVQGQLTAMRATQDETHRLAGESHALLDDELRSILRALVAEEPHNRRQLHALRAQERYEEAWSQPRPLVSVTVATRDRTELLITRSLPSILNQTHRELEVVVVGDHAGPATADAIAALGDPRIVYRNLTQHLRFTEDPRRHWLVAATMARNEAMRLARGSWVMAFDDDDALHPECIEQLLVHARATGAEAVYGRVEVRLADRPSFTLGAFPPQRGDFTWAAAIYHAGLRFFERELIGADMDMPGDWYLASRMLRAGVRFAMVDASLADIHPSAMNVIG